MIEKRVTVILYGSDRNLWGGGPLQIRVSDLFAAGGPKLLSSGKTDASTVELRLQLPFDAGQLYGLTFSAPRHRPAWQMIRRLDFIRTRDQVEGDDIILQADARARFAGNDGRAGRTGTAGPDRVAVCGARHRHRRRRVRAARRGGEDGVPQHRGEAARNHHRRRAADLVRARRASRRGGSRVPAVRFRAEAANGSRGRFRRRPGP